MDDATMQRVNEGLAVVTGMLTLVVLVRVIAGPDTIKLVRMRALRTTARIANKQADFWSSIAANANTHYHKLTDVTI